MKFGSTPNPEQEDLSLPEDHDGTQQVLSQADASDQLSLYTGCAKWNRKDLKNFYPRGTKDELTYYATQFNGVELNATFYNIFDPEQIETWCSKVPENFKFSQK